MPYIKRDQEGKIVTVSHEETPETDEFLENADSELIGFLTDSLSEDSPLAYLVKTDLQMIRVFEDAISLLVLKGVINFTELPASAQEKLINRRKAREKIRDKDENSILVGNDDIIKL